MNHMGAMQTDAQRYSDDNINMASVTEEYTPEQLLINIKKQVENWEKAGSVRNAR